MSGATLWLVALGAALGAVARYEAGRWMGRWQSGAFPWNTWFINVSGCVLLGVLYVRLQQGQLNPHLWLLLGTGFCGAFTTFSTMSVETLQLIRRNPWAALAYLLSSIVCGVVLIWLILWM
ncbi:putative fluoride ion transporter CrcB 2 [Alicyclobacillus contaminans]|uniref:fluoride efflux transporter CrcB n=1 Tax=Alicyclobacillus contaminans TaxID=392016 RepID=UPI0003FF49DC|nr:fluoride efflux transporter CrcB [Alicyclobacillus contaminans]GMA50341.1 putative fluoride ion transporter CrcB 2 [Alicyclobacillus contaminans]